MGVPADVFRGSEAVAAGVLTRAQLRGPAVQRLFQDRFVRSGVADLDAVVRRGLVDRSALAALVAGRSDNGIVLARRAVELADPRAGSRPESKLRVILALAGLHPEPQYWIEDRTGRLVCVDLASPARKLAIEYDGDWRDGEARALNRDRDRLDRVHALGWDVVFVTTPMLRNERTVARTVLAAPAGVR